MGSPLGEAPFFSFIHFDRYNVCGDMATPNPCKRLRPSGQVLHLTTPPILAYILLPFRLYRRLRAELVLNCLY